MMRRQSVGAKIGGPNGAGASSCAFQGMKLAQTERSHNDWIVGNIKFFGLKNEAYDTLYSHDPQFEEWDVVVVVRQSDTCLAFVAQTHSAGRLYLLYCTVLYYHSHPPEPKHSRQIERYHSCNRWQNLSSDDDSNIEVQVDSDSWQAGVTNRPRISITLPTLTVVRWVTRQCFWMSFRRVARYWPV